MDENERTYFIEYKRRWRLLHKDRENLRKREWRKLRYEADRTKVINKLGGKCIHCGFSDVRALQIDHINGGGHSEVNIKFNRSVPDFCRYLLTLSEVELKAKYQLLCANCNWIKRVENMEYN